MNVKTIALTGAEQAISIGGSHAEVKNNGTDTIYASANSGIVAGADGVVSIPAGAAVTVLDTRGTVYLLGTGSVEIVGKDFVSQVFKAAATSGGGGGTEDEVARNAISAHAGNAGIHVTAEEKAAWNGKAELSDIPTELPANGGNAEKVGGKVPADFITVSATRKLDTSVDGALYGTYYCEARFTPDYPLKADGTSYGQFGVLDVRCYGSIFYQTMQFENGVVIHRARVVGATAWSPWKRLCDGGNAASVGVYTEEKIAELEARIASLEGK